MQGRSYSYPKSFYKFVFTVTDCCCMDLPMSHPAVTCSNQAVSEIYLFSPIRVYKQCKNTDEELCKTANAVLSPGCCSSGWSQCAHTFVSCHDSHAARGTASFPHGHEVWDFYKKALGWGYSIVELLQRNWSNTTVPQV